ncbi:hypothetical protein [Bernardetia sp. MNP-M8]|uniref:hypothetical protein n=1 Tax=Bernardetia sp. MNP-M8 TaxID=3127470 RepID=UPI0030D10262
MKTQKTLHFNLKSFTYLFLLGIMLCFSAFSCGDEDTVEPLEIRIENKTGYDLTDITIDKIQITSLKNGEISDYMATQYFEYMSPLSAKITRKFEEELKSFGISSGLWCGVGEYPIKESGKHTFVITLHQNENDNTEYFVFEEK